MKETPVNHCVYDPTYNDYVENGYKAVGCGTDFGTFYFVSFNIVVTMIFLNLFVAIILQSFEDLHKKEHQILNDKSVENFRSIWSQYDLYGEGFIKIDDFKHFLALLGEPLGFSNREIIDVHLQSQFLRKLELPTYNDFQYLYYYDVVTELAKHAYIKIEVDNIQLGRRSGSIIQRNSNSLVNKQSDGAESHFSMIKKQLEFIDEFNSAKETAAVKSAIKREMKLYKNLQFRRDKNLGYERVWADEIIKRQRGSTLLNFKDNLNDKRPSKPQEEEKEKSPKRHSTAKSRKSRKSGPATQTTSAQQQ